MLAALPSATIGRQRSNDNSTTDNDDSDDVSVRAPSKQASNDSDDDELDAALLRAGVASSSPMLSRHALPRDAARNEPLRANIGANDIMNDNDNNKNNNVTRALTSSTVPTIGMSTSWNASVSLPSSGVDCDDVFRRSSKVRKEDIKKKKRKKRNK